MTIPGTARVSVVALALAISAVPLMAQQMAARPLSIIKRKECRS
jgi:hypothetical protein